MKSSEERILATVNGEPIGEPEARAEADRMKQLYVSMFVDQTPEDQERQLLDWATENIIEQRLLRQAAMARVGPTLPETLQKAFDEMAAANGGAELFAVQLHASGVDRNEVLNALDKQLRVEQLILSLFSSIGGPSEEDAREYYAKNTDEFQTPELVRAGHIVVHVNASRTPAEAERLIGEAAGELATGAVFESLVEKYSDCPDNDGDLGWFPRGEMVEEFENVVFALESGQTSGVIESPFGFHIAKLYDRRPAQPQSFEQAREKIAEQMQAKQKERAVEEFVDDLRAKADVRYL